MRYVYIVGLEHSGTTLLAHLLSQNEEVLAIGEVRQFLSPKHMETYLSRWGEYSDARLCSCGRHWEDCDFWASRYHLSGIKSQQAVGAKYKKLLGSLERRRSERVFVDSSKDLACLKELAATLDDEDSGSARLHILFCVKDVRSFASSIMRKKDKSSIISVIRTFNWWTGENRRILEYLRRSETAFQIVQYEKLCFDTQATLSSIYGDLGVADNEPVDVQHNESHIAMGNKDFIFRNRDSISYDYEWFLNSRVRLAYICHRPARRLNERLYEAVSP